MKNLAFILFLEIFVVNVYGQFTSNEKYNIPLIIKDVFFIENKGQWNEDVLFLARTSGLDYWITKYGIVLNFFKITEITENQYSAKIPNQNTIQLISGNRIIIRFLDYNPDFLVEYGEKKNGYYNYFIGNNSAQHASFVPLYHEVLLKNIFPGIDVRFYQRNNMPQCEFIVTSSGHPENIKLRIEGIDSFTGFSNNFSHSSIKFAIPGSLPFIPAISLKNTETSNLIYAILCGDTITYREHQPTQITEILATDPLIYSTYLGGSNHDLAYSMVKDESGQIYITGETNASDFDITPGAYQIVYAGGLYDIFVTKLHPAYGLIFSTFIGGSDEDEGRSIALDKDRNIYITGYTFSADYPISSNAFQPIYGGNVDILVTKIDSTGASLMYSTFLGGNSADIALSITVDKDLCAYITGYSGNNFPVTPGAFQTVYKGSTDAIVTKLNPLGTGLVFSMYLGGTEYDAGYDIAVDSLKNVYVVGSTNSNDFPSTGGSYQQSIAGDKDVFITKIDSLGDVLHFSTYLGGSNDDEGHAIAIDQYNNVYVTGVTFSQDFDVTIDAYQMNNAGAFDVFISKIQHNGQNLLYSTYLGGNSVETAFDIQVDQHGRICITGSTYSSDFDITTNAYQSQKDGGADVFITLIKPSYVGLLYSSFLGGNLDETGKALALTPNGDVYVAGYTSSTNFDVTVDAYQSVLSGYTNVFLSQLCLSGIRLVSYPGSDNQTVCVHNSIYPITYNYAYATSVQATGLPSGVNASYLDDQIIISGTPNTPGSYTYTITLNGTCNTMTIQGHIQVVQCNSVDEYDAHNIFVYPNPVGHELYIQADNSICSIKIVSLIGQTLLSFNLDSPKETQMLNISQIPSGIYYVIIETTDNIVNRKILKL